MKNLGGVLLLALAVTAQAQVAPQVAPGTQVLSVTLGAGIPLSWDYAPRARVGNAGPAVGGRYLYQLKPAVGLGLDLSYQASREKTYGNADTHYTSNPKLLLVLAVGKYSFLLEKRRRPFLIGGLGLGRFSQKKVSSPRPGVTWPDTGTGEARTVSDAASTGLAFALGGGCDMDLGRKLLLSLELRWSQTGIAARKFWGDKYQAFDVGLALGWKFGRSRS